MVRLLLRPENNLISNFSFKKYAHLLLNEEKEEEGEQKIKETFLPLINNGNKFKKEEEGEEFNNESFEENNSYWF